MKTGILYNTKAGSSPETSRLLGLIYDFTEGGTLLVTEPEWINGAVPVQLIEPIYTDDSYIGAIQAKVKALVDSGVERLVCVGGDGTATYVCTALYTMGISLPIIGIAAGTANVGPVISLSREDLESYRIRQTREQCYDGLAVLEDGKLISLAFNDLVIGDTFLATVEGKACNVSAPLLLTDGRLVPKTPAEDLIGEHFRVELNGKCLQGMGGSVKQIIVSPVAHERHYGRAVYGPIGKCDWCEKKGVIALCDHIVVTFDENDAGVQRFSTMQYLIFGPEDQVFLSGLGEGACVICDGNPYLLKSDRIELRYYKDLVRTIKL